MADRYWVGGTGPWNLINTTNWSTTSGGPGGASVPTASDNVFFDANSGGGTITLGTTSSISLNVLTFNTTGFTGSMNSTSGVTNLNVHGSYILGATSGSYSWLQAFCSVNLVATTSGNVITTNGKRWGGGGTTINAPGGVYTLTDTWNLGNGNSTSAFQFFAGTLNTDNYDININNSLSAGGGRFVDFGAGSGTKVLNLGSSTITINATVGGSATDIRQSGSNLTFNPGTSKLKLINVSCFLSTPNITWYEVEINVTPNAISVLVAQTFKTEILNTIGSTPTKRAVIQGNTGTNALQFPMQVSTSASLPDTDIFNIYYVGPAISGDRLGDGGLNAGITFSAPKNCYRIGTGNWNATQWAATSGGSPDVNFFPLPQDTAVFDESTTAGTHTINYGVIGTIDMSARTSALTLAGTTAVNLYGDWKFGTGVTRTYSGAITFVSGGVQNILSNGKSFANAFTVGGPRSVVTLSDALTNTSTLTVTRGTFNSADYNLTVASVASNNSNVRAVSFGSSTITCTGTTPINFSAAGFTFNAGTSSIVCNTASGFTFSGAGFTYYDVSITGTAAVGIGISGVNTFNNLSITAPSAAGMKTVSISNDQIISGTFTISGGAGNQRTLLFSNTLGTPRTLTVNTLSTTDCDFRDITLAGTAAGSSPTRAGDWGGNTGITFPAPKTVYWNLAGSQNWNADAWAASSGGAPSPDNFPLAQDTAVFNNSGSADTVTLLPTYAISTVNMSARSTAMTITTSTNTVEIYGNWLFGSGVTSSSTTGVLTFVKRGTQTITSNGITFGCSVTIGSGTVITSTEVQLADALTLDTARTLTLTIGTFDAVSYNVTTGLFASTGNTTIRTLKLGSGTWSITGTGTCWNLAGINLTWDVADTMAFFPGTAEIVLSNNTSTARTFNGGSFQYEKLTIGGTSSTSTTTINGNNSFTELASTKTVAHTILFQNSTNQYIKTFSVTGSSGNVVTLDRVSSGVWNLRLFGRTSGIDYLNISNCTVAETSPAEFYAGANSTNTTGNTRVVFSAAPSARTLYWVGGTGNWSDSARWSLSSGGAGGQAQPTSVDGVIFDSSSNATGYTVTIDSSLGARCKTFSMGAPASGNVTWAGTQPIYWHDDVSFPGAANITRTHTGTIYLCGTTSGYTLDPNGLTFGGSIVGYGLDAEWTLSGAVILSGSAGIYYPYGTLNTNSYNVTCFQFFSDANNISKSGLSLGASVCTMSGFTMFNIATAIQSGTGRIGRTPSRAKLAVLTFNAGTSTLTGTLSGDTTNFCGAGQTFYNVSHTDTFGRTKRFWGANTYNTFTVCDRGSTQFIDSGSTIGTLVANGISATSRPRVESGAKADLPASSTTPTTLIVNSASTSFCDFRAINFTGTAAPLSVTTGSDQSYNSGINFASKTVYRVGTNTTWVGSSSWALTSGGAGSNANYPMLQDTAVIDDNTALTGTLTVSGGISGLDCSARTIGITLNHGTASTFYGSYILGSGVTLTGTAIQTFAGSGTMVMNPAGKTIIFPIVVNAPTTATFQLGAATTTSNSITLTQGIFDANNQNLTATVFLSNNSNVRTVTMGSGTWTLTGTGAVWDFTTPTNLTFNKGSAEIVLDNTTTSGRTFAGGSQSYNKLTIGGSTGVSTLTITGNNTFTELASTKTVAHTISIAATLQYINAWTITGTSGNLVTLSGTTGAFIYTGGGDVDIDYMTPSSAQAYPVDTWYIGSNSTFVSGLNFYLEAAPIPPPPVVSGGNMFLLFM